MPDEPNNVVSLDSVRKLREFEDDPAVAYVEVLYAERTFAVNVAIRDLEAMRRGAEAPGKPLRDPETSYEAEVLLRRIRWIANYLAVTWDLGHLVRQEDWEGDERAEEDPDRSR